MKTLLNMKPVISFTAAAARNDYLKFKTGGYVEAKKISVIR